MSHSPVTWGGDSPGEHPNSSDGERVCQRSDDRETNKSSVL